MDKSRQTWIEAKSIGNVAFEVLAKDQTAAVMSSLSKGIYIKSASRWLVLLSFERYCSPLTITFKETRPLTNPLPIGTKVHFSSGQMLIPAAGVSITIKDQNEWNPPPRQNNPGIYTERQKRVNSIAVTALRLKPGLGFSHLLPGVLGLQMEKHPPRQALIPLFENIILAQQSIREGRLASVGEILNKFLGVGEGLTPSGDDYVSGVLLTLNRWKDIFIPNDELDSLNQQVVKTAYKGTTMLSANIIECAACGTGDERLIKMVDYLMCGDGNQEILVSDLFNWGSSSGVDAFIGMASVISAMDGEYKR